MKKIFLAIALNITLIYAGGKGYAPIIMGDIITFIPYIKEDIGPDLKMINAVLVDDSGKIINENNKYEAGSSIKSRITLKNVGDKDIPDRDAYYMNVTINGHVKSKMTSIPDLINLAPGKTITFVLDTQTILESEDNNKSITFDININKSKDDDSHWEENLFTEKYKQDNISNNLIIHVYKTDLSITDLNIKIVDRYSNILRNDNTIDISEDNVDGKYVSYCCKLYNNGPHALKHSFRRDMLYKTGTIGDWYRFFGADVMLQANETSSELCVNIRLAKDYVAGDYNYTLDISSFNDLNTSNNTETISYSINN